MSSGAVSEAVAKVEAELATFWAATTDESGVTKARAATMNFVVASVPAEVQHLRTDIEDLAQTRAGRVFLFTLDGRLPPWELESDVSAVCHKEGDTVVCYDRVELHFGAMAAPRAASVLGALALAEVPTIVELAKGAPTTLADALVKTADRVIVDSAHTTVTRIAELAGKTRAPIADRAFVRTFSWRELIARFFDDAPAAAQEIRAVEIERSSDGKHDPSALLVGWLASRLGWRFEGPGEAVDARGRKVSIAIRAGHDLAPGELGSIRIAASLGGEPLELRCVRKGSEHAVRWSMSGAREDAHDHPLGFRDEGWVLRKAIDATESDRVYREAVVAAAAFLAREHAAGQAR